MKIQAEITGRVETGPLQINDDWPGIFVRGDDCVFLASLITMAHDSPDYSMLTYGNLCARLQTAISEATSAKQPKDDSI